MKLNMSIVNLRGLKLRSVATFCVINIATVATSNSTHNVNLTLSDMTKMKNVNLCCKIIIMKYFIQIQFQFEFVRFLLEYCIWNIQELLNLKYHFIHFMKYKFK